MKRSTEALQMGGVRMARNASKKILHISVCSICFSLVILLVLSCITVAPEIKPYCELLFYAFGVLLVISLCVSLYVWLTRSVVDT